MRLFTLSLTTVLLLPGTLLASPSAQAAAGCSTTSPALGATVTCTSAGTETITVPSGTGSVTITAIGGGGGGGSASGATGGQGGAGAVVTATLQVTGGVVAVVVGDTQAGVYNGGGYSLVQVPGSPSVPLVIAGGGGGGGFGGPGTGGAGGSGAASGTASGGNGQTTGVGYGGQGGGAGTGGAGGAGDSSRHGSGGQNWDLGGAGGLGYGGSGGQGGSGWGGGGGGGADAYPGPYAGGGAGGSYVAAHLQIGNATYAAATSGAGVGGAGGVNTYGSPGAAGSVTLTFNAAPTISSVTPATGPVLGGISVYIDGTNLDHVTGVGFGPNAGTITFVTSTRVTAVVPSGYGNVDITVSGTDGSATAAGAFTYDSPAITSVTPSSGPTTGGTSIYIDGTNLLYVNAVTVGGSAATITATTDTRVTATVPASGTAGAKDVVVTDAGTRSATAVGAFTYTSVDNGGSGGGTSAGSTPAASPSPSPVSPTSTTAGSPLESATTDTVIPTQPTIPGLALPTRIKTKGRTVLVPHRLFTEQGLPVTARATVTSPVQARNADARESTKGARIVTKKSGRIVVVANGAKAFTVRLVLTAPGTASAEPYESRHVWRVPKTKSR